MSIRFSNPFLLLIVIGFAKALTRTSPCYFPNGAIAPGNFACFLSQTHSSCCGGGSICEASGLCKVPGSVGVSELIRGTCTDSTWTDEVCPYYCIGTGQGGTNLISCRNVTGSDLDFCCDHTNGCCDSGIGRFQVPGGTDVLTLGTAGAMFRTAGTLSLTSFSSTYGSSTASPTASGTEVSQASSIPSGEATSPLGASKPGLSTGAKAGIGIASAIVGLVIVGAIIYFVLRKVGRRDGGRSYDINGQPYASKPELDGRQREVEMDGHNSRPQELEG